MLEVSMFSVSRFLRKPKRAFFLDLQFKNHLDFPSLLNVDEKIVCFELKEGFFGARSYFGFRKNHKSTFEAQNQFVYNDFHMYNWQQNNIQWIVYPQLFPQQSCFNNLNYRQNYQHFLQPNNIQLPSLPLNEPKTIQKTEERPKKKENSNSGQNQQDFSEKKTERNRNINSIILKEFIKYLQENPTEIYPLLQIEGPDYLMKNFMRDLEERFPAKLAYIRPCFVREICREQGSPKFSRVFRKSLKLFLKKHYIHKILLKKKQKLSYIRECHSLYEKIFSETA